MLNDCLRVPDANFPFYVIRKFGRACSQKRLGNIVLRNIGVATGTCVCVKVVMHANFV